MSMAFTGAAIGAAGLGLQLFGASQAAKAAYNVARSQQITLEFQAQFDKVGANSRYESDVTQGALADINAQVRYEATINHANMAYIGSEETALNLRTGAAVNSLQVGAKILGLAAAAEIDENNAQLQEMLAQSTDLQGQQAEQKSRLSYAQQKSEATVHLAKGGVDLGEGSALATRTSYDVMSESAAIQIQQKTLMEAYGHRVMEENYQIDAGAKMGEAGLLRSANTMSSALANSRATMVESLGAANLDLAKSLASAGFSNDEGMIKLALGGAKINLENSIAAADTKYQFAAAIDPHGAGAAALLSGFSSFASSGFQYVKTGGWDNLVNGPGGNGWGFMGTGTDTGGLSGLAQGGGI